MIEMCSQLTDLEHEKHLSVDTENKPSWRGEEKGARRGGERRDEREGGKGREERTGKKRRR